MNNFGNVKKARQGGFTLVELAIVMMIIGLLIGGILKGAELMENARVTSTISQARSYDAAVTSFRDIYNAWPGDFRNAAARLPNCIADNNCYDGNGNSIVGTSGALDDMTVQATVPGSTYNAAMEPILFWRHLFFADLISGVTTSATVDFGETNPAARIGGGFIISHGDGTVGTGFGGAAPAGHHLVLQASASAAAATTAGAGLINPIRAEQIDRKMDDGNAEQGSVLGYGASGNSAATTDCFNTDDGTYYGNRNPSCSLAFRIQG